MFGAHGGIEHGIPCHFIEDVHLCDAMLDRLEFADRLSEGLALVGVVACQGDTGIGAADAFAREEERQPAKALAGERQSVIGGQQRRCSIGETEVGEAPAIVDRFEHVPSDAVAIEINGGRSEEHTSELQSLMRISYAVFCLKKKKKTNIKPMS